jgi:hypothetical protein
MGNYENIYSESFDVSKIKSSDKKGLMRINVKNFPVAAVVLLHLFTFGIFSFFYYGVAHSHFPKIKSDDFSAGRAIGFSFIPFFNLYWTFIFWLSLVDKINLQLRLRNIRYNVSKGLILTDRILSVIPYINILAIFVFSPICVGFIQSGLNKLAYAK